MCVPGRGKNRCWTTSPSSTKCCQPCPPPMPFSWLIVVYIDTIIVSMLTSWQATLHCCPRLSSFLIDFCWFGSLVYGFVTASPPPPTPLFYHLQKIEDSGSGTDWKFRILVLTSNWIMRSVDTKLLTETWGVWHWLRMKWCNRVKWLTHTDTFLFVIQLFSFAGLCMETH